MSTTGTRPKSIRVKLPRGWYLNSRSGYERYCWRCGQYHYTLGWEPGDPTLAEEIARVLSEEERK